jgi:(4-(4-[2-(gamma-L-glutamylamino)ethyl]phenoxymethyl)furan-2-yl)methanamine synthase
MTVTAGLDVGGAHLKVALVEDGRTVAARQFLCPLWQGLDKLGAALGEARPLLERATRFAVTMTGELSDFFPDRETGVHTLVGRIEAGLGPTARFWMGAHGFGESGEACTQHADVGSTNFLATAALIAHKHAEALLIDFGSTTADIVPIAGGAPRPLGMSDADRQTTGSLVYTGYTRTAVMAVASDAPFGGQSVGLAREYLATMADVRRVLGHDLSGIDLHATADGKGTSLDESRARLARMLGRDARDGTADAWIVAAQHIRELQLRSIHDGATRVLSAVTVAPSAPVVAAGIGAGDVHEIARRLGRDTIDFGQLARAAPACLDAATGCAPAVAVAHLLASETR